MVSRCCTLAVTAPAPYGGGARGPQTSARPAPADRSGARPARAGPCTAGGCGRSGSRRWLEAQRVTHQDRDLVAVPAFQPVRLRRVQPADHRRRAAVQDAQPERLLAERGPVVVLTTSAERTAQRPTRRWLRISPLDTPSSRSWRWLSNPACASASCAHSGSPIDECAQPALAPLRSSTGPTG